jgi:hypothetical protein
MEGEEGCQNRYAPDGTGDKRCYKGADKEKQ